MNNFFSCGGVKLIPTLPATSAVSLSASNTFLPLFSKEIVGALMSGSLYQEYYQEWESRPSLVDDTCYIHHHCKTIIP